MSPVLKMFVDFAKIAFPPRAKVRTALDAQLCLPKIRRGA